MRNGLVEIYDITKFLPDSLNSTERSMRRYK